MLMDKKTQVNINECLNFINSIEDQLSEFKLFIKENFNPVQAENDYSQLDNQIKLIKENLFTVPDDIQNRELQELKNEKEKLLDQIENSVTPYHEKIEHIKEKVVASSLDDIHILLNSKIKSAKDSSIVLTSIMDIVSFISMNEFNDMKWFVKFSENDKNYGARIRFTNLNTKYSDLKHILKPRIEELSYKFSSNGIDIKTKTKITAGEVVETLELTFKFEKKLEQKINSFSRMTIQDF